MSREPDDRGERIMGLGLVVGVPAGVVLGGICGVLFGGVYAVIGVVAGAAASDMPVPLVVMRQVRMQGVTLGSRADFEAMLRACTVARLRPVLDEKRFAFEQAPAAFARMAAGEHFGKIVVDVS